MSSFRQLAVVTFVICCGADRPKDFAAIMDELTGPVARASCVESMLESIEGSMGVKTRHWIEGQVPTFEAALQPLFTSLPSRQGQPGQLSQRVAMYALHRVFVDERGWFLHSLEEHSLHGEAPLPPITSILQNQIPSSAEQAFQACFQNGAYMKELAVLAATLDNLVHQEVLARTMSVFKANKLPLFGSVRVDQMDTALEQVVMSYILEEGGSASAFGAYVSGNLSISDRYPNWAELQRFLHHIEGVVMPAKSTHLKFDDLSNLIHELQVHFGRWQDGECQEQMRELRKMEIEECPGHVNLRDFYAANLYHNKWQFSESADYLRVVGALEESEPDSPRVIMSNYVQGPNNCVASSRYYSQCCINPCSSHLSSLEKAVAGSEVSPELLQSAISMVLPKPEASQSELWDRLRKIARDGKVALHGSSFAEWLHWAYPRDCPAVSGGPTPRQEKPTEYTARTGLPTDFPEHDMRSFVEQGPKPASQCHLKWQVSGGLESWDESEMERRSTGRLLLAAHEQVLQILRPSAPIAAGATVAAAAMLCALWLRPRSACNAPSCDLLVTHASQ
ncbi:hypothetical protein AK812_SmicGene33561 [Symbiodinium microadriaticum]|uniref:Uncharacterized protein n=1 Tax=Symbiodinium microadriaticum TaxID=2951 RepID=A0A1Q9CR68_SYMMI|nr:hypothetical protein AK812_SmicGene33561 [Symbiodinium microadriaticum]